MNNWPFKTVRDPYYLTECGNYIVCTVTMDSLKEMGEFEYPAWKYDGVWYSAELYSRAKAGEWGGVTPYEPPVVSNET